MIMRPVRFQWTDAGAMVPEPQFSRTCDRQFVIGETYTLVVEEPRSGAEHRHYFAAINEAWKNLPEKYAGRFPAPEFLRKWALVQVGYYHEKIIACRSGQDALRLAAFIRDLDEFAVIVPKDDVLKIYTPQSQSARTMKTEDFKISKRAVLDFLDEMIGTEKGTLAKEGMRNAS